jgi:hypothetical protein
MCEGSGGRRELPARGPVERRGRPAIPQEACDAVHATAGYEQSGANLGQTSLDGDMVFSDGYASQLARWCGSPDDVVELKLKSAIDYIRAAAALTAARTRG